MRDPQQLELDYRGQGPQLSMVERDAEVYRGLERSQVFTYINAVERGHKAWADRSPPSLEALKRTLQYIRENPGTFGAHLDTPIALAVAERTIEMVDFVLVEHDLWMESIGHLIVPVPHYQRAY